MLFLHCFYGPGEFGRVYKGVWMYKNAYGKVVSEVVAIKTFKSMHIIATSFLFITS